jgi:hypothetical protein
MTKIMTKTRLLEESPPAAFRDLYLYNQLIYAARIRPGRAVFPFQRRFQTLGSKHDLPLAFASASINSAVLPQSIVAFFGEAVAPGLAAFRAGSMQLSCE